MADIHSKFDFPLTYPVELEHTKASVAKTQFYPSALMQGTKNDKFEGYFYISMLQHSQDLHPIIIANYF